MDGTSFFARLHIVKNGLHEKEVLTPRHVDMTMLSEVELNAALEKGYSDMLEDRTKSAKKAFADIHKDYGIWKCQE